MTQNKAGRFFKWQNHKRKYIILYGFANVVEGLVTLVTLGQYGFSGWSFEILSKSSIENLTKNVS